VFRSRIFRPLLGALACVCSGLLFSGCGFARMIVPLQSPPQPPTARPGQPTTPPPPTARATAVPPTQTPILLPSATLPAEEPPPATLPPEEPPAVAPTAAPAVVYEPPPPTNTPAPPTITPLPSPTVDLTAVYGPRLTPNTKATSFAVIQTITALAASPTYPPTDTPRPRRTPIIIGAGDAAGIRTTPGRAAGVRVLNASRQVSAGGPAALAIRTAPDATCALQIARAQPDGATSLEPIAGSARLSTDRDGGVAWIWAIDADEPAGPLTLVVDCGAAGSQQVEFTVLSN
jgi:hypothetical protein